MNRRSLLVIILFSLLPRAGASQATERLYQQACDDGDMVACNVFGLMYEYGEGVPREFSRARGLYQRACEGGELVGCTNLGLMYEAGMGVPQDIARAVGLYQVACEGGELLACSGIGGVERPGVASPAERFFKTGLIGDTETGAVLSGAIIEVPALGIRVISDVSGRFQLAGVFPDGRYALKAERLGYEALEGEVRIPGNPEFLVLLTPSDVEDPFAPGGVAGRVTDEGGDRGLSAVDVMVLGQPQVRTLSNRRGRFSFTDLEPGLAELRFTRLGYAPRTATLIVHPGRTVEVSATMFAEPIELEPITVTVRSRFLEQNGFYRRAEGASSGSQFTRDDIDLIQPVLASDVIRRVPGFAVEYDAFNPDRVFAVNRRSNTFSRGPCNLAVFVDGVARIDTDLNQIPPDQIEAIEIYHGISTPIEFLSSRNSCGVVLIWTRR